MTEEYLTKAEIRRENAEAVAARLRKQVEQRIQTAAYRDGYHEAIRNLMDELYPRCSECGRPLP